MLAVNYTTLRNKLKNYCDEAVEKNQTIIVTRKEEKNVVMLSLEKYNRMMKIINNAEYLAMIDRGVKQLAAGKGQQHELIEADDDE